MIGYNDRFEDMIQEAIMDLNPTVLDDDLPDLYIDSEERDKAIDYLINVLNEMRDN